MYTHTKHNEVLLGCKKKRTYRLLRPRGYCAKWDKSARQRRIPYNFTYMQNRKSKVKQTNRKQKRAHKYREQTGGGPRVGVGGWAEWGKGSGRYNLLVMERIGHRNERYSGGNPVNGIVIARMLTDGSHPLASLA